MTHLKNVLLLGLLSTAATTGSCKVRGNGAPTKQSGASENQPAAGPTDVSSDLSKAPIFVSCKTGTSSKTLIEMSLRHDPKSGAAESRLKLGNDADSVAMGRWDNFDDPSSSQYLYSFGGLRFIITNDKAAGGFYPGTLVGTTQNDRYLEENLFCSKT